MPSPQSFDILSLLRAHEGSNLELHRAHVNPQFMRVLKAIGFDRIYTRAQGQYLWDVEGNRYLDFLGGYAVLNMGRNHPVIRQALIDVMNADHPSWVAFDAPVLAGVLAGELKKRMPAPHELEYVFFTNSGTEGIEAAIKFAKCATGRPGILHAKKAFHGLSSGALSINGDESFREGFGPFLPGCRAVPFGDLAALEYELGKGDVAGFIVEPIQGKGVNLPPPGYLRGAAELCHKHGALFVADEVQTGVGRTGKFLALEHEVGGVDVDIVVLSKALSGGYVPVGAVLTRKSVWKKVFSSMERAIVHSSTFHMGSLAMAAGLASLHVLDSENLIERSATMGDKLMRGLNEMKSRYEFIKDVRGRGLMIGIEFGQPRSLKLRTGWSLMHKMDENLFPQAIVIPLMTDHRIITQVAGHAIDVIKLIPPLIINDEDVTYFLCAFEQVMDGLHRFPGPVWEVMRTLGRMATPAGSR